jgi:hypothetical protein
VSLKWAGTPRACWTVTQATSLVTAAPSSPAAVQPIALRTGTQVATQARVRVVRPKESPKVVGLRHDTAPDADPPATAHRVAWARPMRISPAPTRYARR